MTKGVDWRGTEWDKWGQRDPYFGVLSHDRFRRDRMTNADRAEFFSSGERDVEETFAELRRIHGRDVRPEFALDFGCGVGRLTIPIARKVGHVTAVDVSPAMLEETRANCALAGLTNVEIAASLDAVPGGQFDFVHSYIVFQHVPPAIGMELIAQIVGRLAPGGVGMLHVTYGRTSGRLKRLAHSARRSSRLAHALLNFVQRRPLDAPLMAMFEYDLARVLGVLRSVQCEKVTLRMTDHAGCQGAMIFFERPGVS